jgi:hypothetical protein
VVESEDANRDRILAAVDAVLVIREIMVSAGSWSGSESAYLEGPGIPMNYRSDP